jgi:hypothetical protein
MRNLCDRFDIEHVHARIADRLGMTSLVFFVIALRKFSGLSDRRRQCRSPAAKADIRWVTVPP